jgi:DNA polymerase-1
MPDNPLLLVDGHNLLFRACFGTPAQIWSRDPDDKRELTTEFMFFALLRRGINEELPGWPEVVVVFDGQERLRAAQADRCRLQGEPARRRQRAEADPRSALRQGGP